MEEDFQILPELIPRDLAELLRMYNTSLGHPNEDPMAVMNRLESWGYISLTQGDNSYRPALTEKGTEYARLLTDVNRGLQINPSLERKINNLLKKETKPNKA